jgi:proline dehydrogenase
MTPRVMKAVATRIVRRAARAYIAGPELADALHLSRRLDAAGLSTTICFWDGPGDTPAGAAAKYREALDAIAGQMLDCYLSVKAPALEFAGDLFFGIFERAHRAGRKIHFDSLGLEAADRTFDLVAAARRLNCNAGCTLPGRWHRSLDDAGRAVDLGASVRVVKGQWPDTQPEIDHGQGFLNVIDRLAGRARQVAVATHNPRLAEKALTRLRASGTSCELELLFGLPGIHMLPVAQKAGVPVRFYVPYGHAWLPYALRQMRRDPRILLRIFRDCVSGHGLGIADKAARFRWPRPVTAD